MDSKDGPRQGVFLRPRPIAPFSIRDNPRPQRPRSSLSNRALVAKGFNSPKLQFEIALYYTDAGTQNETIRTGTRREKPVVVELKSAVGRKARDRQHY